MKYMTRLGALLFALMIVAAACGGGATDAATVSEGKLTICSEVPYEPFEMEDGSGGYTGFDIELADAENPERDSGLVILGMGKLGARELNYSSDIDLISSACRFDGRICVSPSLLF